MNKQRLLDNIAETEAALAKMKAELNAPEPAEGLPEDQWYETMPCLVSDDGKDWSRATFEEKTAQEFAYKNTNGYRFRLCKQDTNYVNKIHWVPNSGKIPEGRYTLAKFKGGDLRVISIVAHEWSTPFTTITHYAIIDGLPGEKR
jgi:hypothetical protein